MGDSEIAVVEVFNLETGKFGPTYSCGPREAVIAAHAQSLGDFNTWDYETKYRHLLVIGDQTIRCGNFTAVHVGHH